MVSDTHTNEATEGEPSLYRGRLQKAINGVNDAEVDFVVLAGDLTNDGKEEQTRAFLEQIKGFQAPLVLVPGNHDVGNKPLGGKPDGITAERVRNFEERVGPSFFAQTLAGVRVVGINSLLMGSKLSREADQWQFLEKELIPQSTMPVVVVSHQPPYLMLSNEPGGDYWNIEPEPRKRLLGLLARGGVCAFLSGHIHRALANYANGTLFFSTPPVAFGLPPGLQPQAWTLVTLNIGETDKAEVSCDIRLIADKTGTVSSPLAAPPLVKKLEMVS